VTLFIATVTASAAFLTQDTALSQATRLPQPGEAMRVIDPRDRDQVLAQPAAHMAPSLAPRLLGYGDKHRVIPGRPIAIGGGGHLVTILAWAELVETALKGADIDDLEDAACHYLPLLHRQWGLGLPAMVCQVGWSARHGRARGFVYFDGDGFLCRPLDGFHAMQPLLSLPEHLAQRWEPAAAGQDTGRFHHDLGFETFRAARGGAVPGGSCIGGELVTVRVGSVGVSETRTALAAPDAFEGASRPV